MKVLKQMYKQKASISDPDGFKDKVRLYEKSNVVKAGNDLKRQKSNISSFSKSNKSGPTNESHDDEHDNDTVDEEEQQEGQKKHAKVKNAPVI